MGCGREGGKKGRRQDAGVAGKERGMIKSLPHRTFKKAILYVS